MYEKPTELLDEIGSHGICSAEILNECSFDTSRVPTYSPKETAETIEARGIGGTMPEETGPLVYGYSTAAALAEQLLGSNPGAMFMGRGSQFRACYQGLERAGH